MIFQNLKQNIIVDDEEFNSIYPDDIRALSAKHWTPVAVAKIASAYLVNRPAVKVLDIGSGVGKFCMIGAALTEGHFTGVEYRENLYLLANKYKKQFGLRNVEFIHSNILDISFKEYNAFYFFNSFIENMSKTELMDEAVPVSPRHYSRYTQHLREQLAGMPIGTRLATYWSNTDEVPRGYVIQSTSFDGELKMWEKLF
jgi:hypothetical protein